jgi:hypothetical protein
MKWAAAVLACALPAAPAVAQDVVVEITESALNRVAAQLGAPSDGGVFMPPPVAGMAECTFFGMFGCGQQSKPQAQTPPQAHATTGRTPLDVVVARCKKGDTTTTVLAGAPVVWQWWVTEARFDARAGALEFSAKVRHRVGDKWDVTMRSVPATITLDAAANRFRLNVQAFKVPLTYTFLGVSHQLVEVDVSRLFSAAVPVPPSQLYVPLHNANKAISARAASASAQYEEGLVRVNLQLSLQ